MASCNKQDKVVKIDPKAEGYIKLFCLNTESTKLVEVDYLLIQKDTDKAVNELMAMLAISPESADYKVPIPEGVKYLGCTLKEGYVTIDFDAGYSKMDRTTEILCRAALAKTLTQLKNIDFIEITVNGQALTGKDEKPVGLFNDEIFVDANGSDGSYNQYGDVTLFFANEEGDRLKEYHIQLEMNNNVPIEQLIMERLIKGPQKEGYYLTIPSGTKAIKTSIKDGVCYVDLSPQIQDALKSQVTDEVIIYSIVNSLVELPTVNKVQFTVDGEKQAKYRESMAFDGLFERKLDLIEMKKIK